MVSTVGTSTTVAAVSCSMECKTFAVGGYYYLVYSDGTNLVYRSSLDNVNWSSAVTICPLTTGSKAALTFDGTRVHIATGQASAVSYRRGTPSAGVITFDTVQTVSSLSNCNLSSICVDSSGCILVGYVDYSAGYPYVSKNANTIGSAVWSTASGYPKQLTTTADTNFYVKVMPLSGGQWYAHYMPSSGTLKGKLWNGSALGSEEICTAVNVSANYRMAAVSDPVNNLIHLAYNAQPSGYEVRYRQRSSSGSWGTEISLQTGCAYTTVPAIVRNDYSGKIYVIWYGYPTASHVYYRVSSDGGTTFAAVVDALTETNISQPDMTSVSEKQWNNSILLAWTIGTASPYNVRFHTIASPGVPAVNLRSPSGGVAYGGLFY